MFDSEVDSFMKEFFGIGGFTREPEGYLSWQHLTFVSFLMIAMVALAVFLGLRNKNRDDKKKNAVLIWAALLIDGFEIFKIILNCSQDPEAWKTNLPLFLCSIQLITIPLAAFTRGRIKEASLDFVCIFGILGAVLGTIGAGQNYNAYPVLSFPNVVSGITHSISGFASLYIMISGLVSLKRKNMWITFSILGFFCAAALTANKLLDYNYMFLVRGDGTPYDVLYNLVGGSPILYPVGVILLFLLYISVYYLVFCLIQKRKAARMPQV
jgi:uncharacterized membrane protein YwaF